MDYGLPGGMIVWNQRLWGRGLIVTETPAAGDPRSVGSTAQAELRKLDPSLPITAVKTMEEHLGFAYWGAEFGAGLLSSFALLGLVLSAVGLYGLLAGTLAALGARRALASYLYGVSPSNPQSSQRSLRCFWPSPFFRAICLPGGQQGSNRSGHYDTSERRLVKLRTAGATRGRSLGGRVPLAARASDR